MKKQNKKKEEKSDKSWLFVMLVIGIFLGATFTYSMNSEKINQVVEEPTKAKVLMQVGDEILCVESELTIEEWYFQAKLFASMNQLDKISPICN